MTDIHEGHCTCDRCIQQLADAILGNLDKPSRLPAEMRLRPMSDIPEERQTEWHFKNGAKLVFKGEPEPYVGSPEPLIAFADEEPTLIEETPAGLREKLDAVNARLAAMEKEEKEKLSAAAKKLSRRIHAQGEREARALEQKMVGEFRLLAVDEMVGADGTTAAVDKALKLDPSTEAVIARKRARGTLSDPETCEHLFSWRIGKEPCRLCGAPPGAQLAADYEAMGYPETEAGQCNLDSVVALANAAVNYAGFCAMAYPWQPSEENNEAR